MTTAAENERLSVLETKVSAIEKDVSEIKGDVKTLVINAATRRASEEAEHRKDAQVGVWVRFLSERGIAILALAASIIAILSK